MAEFSLATASEKQIWSTKAITEWTRNSRFKPYMGRSENSPIQVKYELQEEAGKTINIPLFTRLKGAGRTGSQVLDGFEEELANYNTSISLEWRRNAVVLPKSSTYKTEINVMDIARPALTSWAGEKTRDAVITALNSILVPGSVGGTDTVVTYALATDAQRNAFGVANQDRVLFGAAESNYSATWATALANIDTTADIMSTAVGSLARYMARTAGMATTDTNPHIRPIRAPNGGEHYLMLTHPTAFRQLKADTAMLAANRDARPRDVSENPIFQDGDLLYDGVIYHEVPELESLTLVDVGASSAEVAPSFLLGPQAIGVAMGQETKPTRKSNDDYQFRPGVGIEDLIGFKKLSLGGLGVQNAVVSVFTAVT